MKILGTIKEHHINPDSIAKDDSMYSKERSAVRFIIFDKDGKIALNHRPEQMGYLEQFSIPGGGVGEGEDKIMAVEREAKEEIGCEVKDLDEIGCVLEYGIRPGVRQTTCCFVGRVDGRKGTLELSKEEKASNLDVIWLKPSEAREAIKRGSYGFYKIRSLMFLDELKRLKLG